MHANCPPESGGQHHRVFCDDARGGSANEMFQNAFLKGAAWEPPTARSRLLSRSCCPPDSGGQGPRRTKNLADCAEMVCGVCNRGERSSCGHVVPCGSNA